MGYYWVILYYFPISAVMLISFLQAVEEASAAAEKAEGPFLTGAELTLKATQELNQ